MNEKEKVVELFFEIIDKLNNIEDSSGGMFDCGHLGLIEVYWYHHKWEYRHWDKSKIVNVAEFLLK